MKPLTDTIHRTPWWALFAGGLLILLALAAFVTPYHIIDYRKDPGASPEEQRAIKREIDNAFADNAIDIARGVLSSMRNATTDERRREELDQALQSLDEARVELREAGREVIRAKREAAQDARRAVKEATDAIRQAQKDAEQALSQAGVHSDAVRKSLDESLAAARKAQEEARHAADDATREAEEAMRNQARIVDEKGRRRIVIGNPGRKPMIDIEIDAPGSVSPPTPPPVAGAEPPAPPAPPVAGAEPPAPPEPPKVLLAPELRTEIRRNVTHDLYRIGVGAGLILVFIPLFILVIVSKFFIDRSRAALRMADLKRKEAEYHRMSQQVTEAKLSALQAQVEPHFLYNTLASVQALTEVDPQKAHDMTGHLIQYLRNALPKMRESVSTVGQEIELVRAYLNILQMRMGKRLAFTIDVPAELTELPFPPLMLPSLVENAIKHGLEPQREGGEVHIRAELVGERLRMIVADTGRGFAETLGAGVGLANIRERLATMYGADASLALEANEPRGVVATIEVPKAGARPSANAGVSGATLPLAGMAADAAPRTRTRKFIGAMGTAERAWRKALSFAFVVLVAAAAVLSGLGIVAVATGILPAHLGPDPLPGPAGTLVGTAGIAVAFAAVVMAIAIVLAVLYGLGFLFVALAIFVPIVVLVGLFPVLAPFILLGLGIWWLVRRRKRQAAQEASVRVSPVPPAP
jgi:hypothetical protein